MLVVFVPIGVIVGLMYGFMLPPTPLQRLASLASLALGAPLTFYYGYVLGLFSFWLIRNPFTKWHLRNVELIFSGQFFPLWLYPAWLSRLTEFLPFRYFTYEPLAIYLGKTPVSEIPRVLALQVIWLVLLLFMKNKTKGRYEYRISFWIDSVSFVLGHGAQALMMVLLTQKFETINGWRPVEVMPLSAYTLANTVMCDVMWKLSQRIRTGDFDQTLIKPTSPLAYEIVSGFSAYYLLHFVLAVGMVALGVAGLGARVTALTVMQVACGIVGGAAIQAGVLLMFSAASFFLINNPLSGAFYSNIRPLFEYPITIYPKFLQILLTAVVPLAFLAIALRVWRAASRHYTSTGS